MRVCRGYNAQHCLVSLIEKWKKNVDNGGAFGALLTDLSKTFDCLPHELLIAKLDTYCFDKSSLKVKCPCKNRSLHEYTEAKNNHEVFCNFSI